MSVQFNTLTPEAWEALHNVCLGLYLDGECYAFAAGLQEVTDWDIVALVTPEHPIRHAAVRDHEGNLYDVRGKVSLEEFGEPFHVAPPYNLKVVEVDDLRVVRPVSRVAVWRAAQMAEILWPDIVRTNTPNLQKIQRFAADLEQLSRQHGVWIRAPYPAARPCLAIGEGDELGYDVTPSDDGNGYFVDRRLGRR